MTKDPDPPIDRDAWRRALASDAGAPPHATDLRIRAEARRALAPTARRWWLPASLAASLLLAVLIVQWQYEDMRATAPVTEAEVATTEAAVPADAADAVSPAADAAAPAANLPAPLQETAGRATAESRESVAPPPAIRPLPMPAEAPAVPAPARSPEAPAPASKSESPSAVGAAIRQERMRAFETEDARTPEEWYAQIETLRAAGKIEDAEAELARLEAAHPGWVERHLAGQGR